MTYYVSLIELKGMYRIFETIDPFPLTYSNLKLDRNIEEKVRHAYVHFTSTCIKLVHKLVMQILHEPSSQQVLPSFYLFLSSDISVYSQRDSLLLLASAAQCTRYGTCCLNYLFQFATRVPFIS